MLFSVTCAGEWRLDEAKLSEPGCTPVHSGPRKTAEPVVWRLELRVFAFLASDGARFAPGLAWRLPSSASIEVLFRAMAHLLGFGTSRARSSTIVCSRLGLR